MCFFFNDTATTEIYTLSLHDALPISTGSFAVKRGFWEKILSSPDKTDVERWNRPLHLVRFTPWNIEDALERCLSFDQYGYTEIFKKEDYIAYLKQGFISIIQLMYENIQSFLIRVYENWQQSYICEDVLSGILEHQKRQMSSLKKKIGRASCRE